MATANGDSERRWGSRLPGGGLARAIAGGGVLAAIDASRKSGRNASPEFMSVSAAELLRQLLSEIVPEESPLLPWAMPVDDERVPPSWMPAPQELVEIWSDFLSERQNWFRNRAAVDGQGNVQSPPPRTGVRLKSTAPLELLEPASRDLIGQFTDIDSLSMSLGLSKPSPRWNWPIKLRILATPGVDEDALQELRREVLTKRPWMGDHLTVLPIDSVERADFAWVFVDHAASRAPLLRIDDAAFNADCLLVAIAGGDLTAFTSSLTATRRILRRLEATGIVLQPNMEVGNQAVSWMIEFVRELSHLVTVDVAAMRASEWQGSRKPTLLLSEAFLANSHVGRRKQLILERLDGANAPNDALTIDDATSQALGVRNAIQAPDLATALRARLTSLDFGSESSGASVIAAISALADQIPPRPPTTTASSKQMSDAYDTAYVLDAMEPDVEEDGLDVNKDSQRFLQAQLLRVKKRRLVEKFRSLPHLGTCFVRVRVGYEEGAWPKFGNVPFPTDRLPPPDAGGWTLQVYVFTNSEEPHHATMFLPASGNSQPVEFMCRTGDGWKRFKARIVVAHQNRVLQSAWIEAPVEDEDGKAKGRLSRGLEAVVKQNLTSLDERSAFDAFLVVNDSLTERPGVAIGAGSSAVLRTPPDLPKTINFIDGELTKVSEKPELYEGGLESPGVVRMLRSLAQYGSLMYEAIVLDHEVDQALIAAERVQVVAAESWARLPIEFFYDRPAPDQNAPLCPGAKNCLGGSMTASPSRCNDACPPAGASKDVICPRGFWGLRKVIEWHRHSGNKEGDSNFRLSSEPVAERKSIKAFQSVLFAHSDRVNAHDDQASSMVLAALKSASSQTGTASDWVDWRSGVSSTSPLLMVVLPHNEESSNQLSELSIGPGQTASHRLLVTSIDDGIVKGPNTIPGPIIMLLGCETGAPKTSYLGYVPKLRRHGASIIVSTGSVVLGRQISPICVRLIEGLKAAIKTGPAPLGEVMLRLRREALADGYPIVLALSASGDADWLIE